MNTDCELLQHLHRKIRQNMDIGTELLLLAGLYSHQNSTSTKANNIETLLLILLQYTQHKYNIPDQELNTFINEYIDEHLAILKREFQKLEKQRYEEKAYQELELEHMGIITGEKIV